MTQPLLNLSGKIDPILVEVCASVAHCAEKLQIPYLVVGAFARDLVMHYGYGAAVQRATEDIDFALQVPSWDAFAALKTELIANGFTKTKSEHRLIALNNYPIDIVPFGGVADHHANIQWPPSGDIVMNVLGFQEALENADTIRLRDKPNIEMPVASPVGMMLLKLIAWLDRTPDMRNKDTKDILYLLTNYEMIPAISDRLYSDQDLMAIYDWNITLAAAHLLGMETKHIASSNTAKAISELFNNRGPGLQIYHLVNEMGGGSTHQTTRNETLITAFKVGFENQFDTKRT